MINVGVIASLDISWQAPTEDVDGNPLPGLDSYRIFYGRFPGDYDDSVVVPGSATSHSIQTVSGEYYVAMPATESGEESALSAEVLIATR